jgi:hypothetical protein
MAAAAAAGPCHLQPTFRLRLLQWDPAAAAAVVAAEVVAAAAAGPALLVLTQLPGPAQDSSSRQLLQQPHPVLLLLPTKRQVLLHLLLLLLQMHPLLLLLQLHPLFPLLRLLAAALRLLLLWPWLLAAPLPYVGQPLGRSGAAYHPLSNSAGSPAKTRSGMQNRTEQSHVD